MVALTNERDEHSPAIERLLGAAFVESRWHKTSQRLRDGRVPLRELSLVALDGDTLVGTVRLWPVVLGQRHRRALLLGPLAVAEEARSLGLGAMLIRESLDRAEALGHRAVLLVGDAPYYARFGFERRFTDRLVLPGPVERARFLGLELVPGALEGAQGRVRATAAVDPAALPHAA